MRSMSAKREWGVKEDEGAWKQDRDAVESARMGAVTYQGSGEGDEGVEKIDAARHEGAEVRKQVLGRGGDLRAGGVVRGWHGGVQRMECKQRRALDGECRKDEDGMYRVAGHCLGEGSRQCLIRQASHGARCAPRQSPRDRGCLRWVSGSRNWGTKGVWSER